MKQLLTITLMLIASLGFSQDTIPPLDTVPRDFEIIDFTVVVDSLLEPDSTWTVTKRVEETKVMSIEDYDRRVSYLNRKIRTTSEVIAKQEVNVQLLKDVLAALGEPASIADNAEARLANFQTRLADFEAELASLTADKDSIEANYRARYVENYGKRRAILDAKYDALTVAELDALLEERGLQTNGNERAKINRLLKYDLRN